MTNILSNTAKANGWRMLGAGLGLFGGLLSAVLGSLLTVGSWLAREPHNRALLHQLGSVLLCSTIPLLLLGGFCLDWLWPKAVTTERRDVADEDD